MIIWGQGKSWPAFRDVDDRVRGGASTSHLTVLDNGGVRFSGNLDIDTLGGAGFASQAARFEPPVSFDSSAYAGIVLTYHPPPSSPQVDAEEEEEKSKPHLPRTFTLTFKNKVGGKRPDGRLESAISFEYSFTPSLLQLAPKSAAQSSINSEKQPLLPLQMGGKQLQSLRIPWKDFEPTYRGRPAPEASRLDPGHLVEMSLMCRSDFGSQAGPFALEIDSIGVYKRKSLWEIVKGFFSGLYTSIGRLMGF